MLLLHFKQGYRVEGAYVRLRRIAPLCKAVANLVCDHSVLRAPDDDDYIWERVGTYDNRFVRLAHMS